MRSRLWARLVGVALMTTLLNTGCAAARPDRDAPGKDAVGPGTHVPRFAKVCDDLYRGGQPSPEGFAELKEMGVKTIVSLRVFNSDRKKLAGLGLRYMRVSCKHAHPEDEDAVAFLRVASDPQYHPIFVHCRDGVDRTGMMVALYRIVVEGWSKEKALAEMKEMGFHEIWDSIEDYVEDLDVECVRNKLCDLAPPRIELVP